MFSVFTDKEDDDDEEEVEEEEEEELTKSGIIDLLELPTDKGSKMSG